MKEYVKEYKGYKVPEGAAYYGPKNNGWSEGFYDNEKHALAYVTDGVLLRHERSPFPICRKDLVELPLEITEYIPDIGEYCSYSLGTYNTWNEGYLRFLDKLVVIEGRNGRQRCYDADMVKFRPTKSEREKTIEEALKLSVVGDKTLLSTLYDKGMLRLPPEGPKNRDIKDTN